MSGKKFLIVFDCKTKDCEGQAVAFELDSLEGAKQKSISLHKEGGGDLLATCGKCKRTLNYTILSAMANQPYIQERATK